MQSFQSSPARPIGPRSLHRPASPHSFPEVAPLNVRPKAFREPSTGSSLLSPPSNGSPSRSTTPTLAVPTPGIMPGSSPRRKPAFPKLNFDGIARGAGPAFEGIGGPQPHNSPQQAFHSHPTGDSEPTIRPPDHTISPQKPSLEGLSLNGLRQAHPPPLSMDDLRQTVEEFDQWSDDTLEELARLGEGAGGAVYKVRDRRTNVIMARKAITTLEAPMKQLLREIRITSSTEHPNIVHFYGAYISPNCSEVKVLMEYCEGGSLESVGKRMREIGGRVGEKVAGRLAEGILQGLAYLHSRKTIHRDIKPPNILLTREGVVKLADFGVSGELINSIAGTFTGTSLYMAPERLSGNDYTIRSDVWSTGITLLELVTNRFPFPTDFAAIELMMYIVQNEPPELEDEEGITYTPEMKDFIKKTLTRDPHARPSPKEMLEHPWIVSVMQYKLDMAYWMRKVWNWRRDPRDRKKGDEHISRPNSSRSERPSLDASMASLSISNSSSET